MAGKHNKAAFDRPEIVLTLALALAKNGKAAAVREMLEESVADHPSQLLYERLARYVLAASVPAYHDAMLADHARNAAYRQAIEAAVQGKNVLDIGTGSGLLAMIAARAGAKRVVACEMNKTMAETAKRIIAANGLTDRIEVHSCHSSELDRETVCPEGFDVVISEIFSANVLGEGVLQSLEHVREKLCAKGARFIPESAEIRVALAQFPQTTVALDDVEGFDLGLFADHLLPAKPLINSDPGLTLMSDVGTLVRFDFGDTQSLPTTGLSQVDVHANQGGNEGANGGEANGIAQWLLIDFGNGDSATYENAPGRDEGAHWSIVGYPFAKPCPIVQGEAVTIHGFYHDDALVIWSDLERGGRDPA